MQDRIDEIVKFDYPKEKEREDILRFNSLQIFSKENIKYFEKNIKNIVNSTKGFSGRELTKFVVSLYYHCLLNDYKLNNEIITKTLAQFTSQKRIKNKWKININNTKDYKH